MLRHTRGWSSLRREAPIRARGVLRRGTSWQGPATLPAEASVRARRMRCSEATASTGYGRPTSRGILSGEASPAAPVVLGCKPAATTGAAGATTAATAATAAGAVLSGETSPAASVILGIESTRFASDQPASAERSYSASTAAPTTEWRESAGGLSTSDGIGSPAAERCQTTRSASTKRCQASSTIATAAAATTAASRLCHGQ